ncbi:DUF3048 domain-containing protein [Bacillus horti]|uniref:DUF3048 domain-containing protein n=1 Tax=Caldalkalibacillus horti TaxID=77523 RepID=UPI0027D89B49|nr:DUF3048 domain-containing protein [Bacillus horti]
MKRWWFLGLTMLLLFFVVACSNNEPVDIEAPDEANEEEIEEVEEDVEAPFTASLTGLGVQQEITDRIIAVMINNQGSARPQSGLDQADMIYEILAEGEITRLVAFFQSQSPDVIGPVRSLRPYLIDLATGFDAVFAHAGGSPEALSRVQTEGLASLDEIYNAGNSFYRVDFRRAPHNLYTSLERLRAGAEGRGFRQEGEIPTLLFKDTEEEMTGTEATNIRIDYHSLYHVAYEYDESTQLYTRTVRDEPHIDMETNEVLTTTNLLVIETHHRVLDDVGRRAIDVMSEGKGYLFQRGKMQEVDWKRIDGVIRPLINGREVGLYPGVTWVNVIPDSPGLTERVQIGNGIEQEDSDSND